jgi:hypothetical protein
MWHTDSLLHIIIREGIFMKTSARVSLQAYSDLHFTNTTDVSFDWSLVGCCAVLIGNCYRQFETAWCLHLKASGAWRWTPFLGMLNLEHEDATELKIVWNFTSQHFVISQTTWILSSTAVRISSPAYSLRFPSFSDLDWNQGIE